MKKIVLTEIDGVEKTGRSIITTHEKLEELGIDLKKCIKHHTAKHTLIPFDKKMYSELDSLL